MAEMKKMSEEESLRRSHSKTSNAKLTLICLLFALAIPVAVASAATIGTGILPDSVALIGLIAGAAVGVLSFLLISRFKR